MSTQLVVLVVVVVVAVAAVVLTWIVQAAASVEAERERAHKERVLDSSRIAAELLVEKDTLRRELYSAQWELERLQMHQGCSPVESSGSMLERVRARVAQNTHRDD